MNKKIRATTFPNFFKQNNFLLKKIMWSILLVQIEFMYTVNKGPWATLPMGFLMVSSKK
jgi:hypothetical protein